MSARTIRSICAAAVSLVATCVASAQQMSREEYNDAACRAHAVEDDYEKAERLYRAAIASAESAGLRDETYVKSLNGLAEVLEKQAKYADAEPILTQAITIIEALRGSESAGVIGAIGCLTQNQIDQCQFAKAIPF